jgi:hypothetical protein
VKRVVNGVIEATPVLDLAVNSNSERGLLSLVLDPGFPATPFVYVRWTESSTGVDTSAVLEVPLLGNRVDRFVWDGSTLSFDRNIIRLRSLQTDNIPVPGHPGTNNANPAGNHNGGVMRFGPDGKLYLFMGDQGRRGWLQNLANGPFESDPFVDDTFGGPEPDDAHSPAWSSASTTTAARPPTTRSSPSGGRSAAKLARTSRRSTRTATGTGSGWRSIRTQVFCGRPRTATTPSAN